MPWIDPQLLERLQKKLNIGQAAVYRRIEKIANSEMLDRPEAALALAAKHGINISKYATSEQKRLIRGARGKESSPPEAARPPPERKQPTRTTRKARTRQAKGGKKLFVVHGRNKSLNKDMFRFLRALGLQPIEWSTMRAATRKATPYIGEILDKGFQLSSAAVVLMTPDDEARLDKKHLSSDDESFEKELRGQPRQNVLFEAGAAWSRYPEKTVLVTVGKLRPFSDIAGQHVVRLSNDPGSRREFAARLQTAGLDVDDSGTEWLSEGNFTV